MGRQTGNSVDFEPDFFEPLYSHPRIIRTLQGFISFFCRTMARHARVGQKSSDVNDAELPHLEGMSR